MEVILPPDFRVVHKKEQLKSLQKYLEAFSPNDAVRNSFIGFTALFKYSVVEGKEKWVETEMKGPLFLLTPKSNTRRQRLASVLLLDNRTRNQVSLPLYSNSKVTLRSDMLMVYTSKEEDSIYGLWIPEEYYIDGLELFKELNDIIPK